MNEIIITRQGNAILSAYYEEGKGIVQFHVALDARHPKGQEDRKEKGKDVLDVRIGDIYLGMVQNIVRNIRSAFVEIAPGVTGYMPLTESQYAICVNPKKSGELHIGDSVLVQVAREPVKSKPVSLTTDFVLSGKCCVLLPFHPGVRLSSKIKEQKERKRLLTVGESFAKEYGFGCILRTNATGREEGELMEALVRLAGQFHNIRQRGLHSTRHTRLYTGLPAYLADLRDMPSERLIRIRTDEEDLYQEMKQFLQENQSEDVGKLEFYQDRQISLTALYRIRTCLEHALAKRVWMKSGAFLVIEPTEALTVIDVNSGKAVKGRKNFEDTVLAVNLEAASEIATQLRLRSLSGMILIDFINMKLEESNRQVMERLREELKHDPTKAAVVDMTGLGLVEVTRKRVRKPLHEIQDVILA